MSNKKRFNDKPVIVVLCLLFIYPLGAIFLWTGEAFSKAVKIGLTVGFGLLFFAAVFSPKSDEKATEETVEKTTAEIEAEIIEGNNPTSKKLTDEERDEAFKYQFHFYDNSHMDLEREIKKQLKDPDSYEHIGTTSRLMPQDNDYMMVSMKYRARNSFGGMVVNTVKAKIHVTDGLIEIYQ